MENEKETIDLNEGDFIDIYLHPEGSFFGRVIKKYNAGYSSYFVASVCDYSAKSIFYKLIRILEGNLFMIQDASSFAEETKGEDIYVKVRKINETESCSTIYKLLKRIDQRMDEEIIRDRDIKRLFE